MSEKIPEKIAETLKPYRARIDDIDAQIIDLLRLRYDVIEEVGVLKERENFDPVLQGRVDEVRENAAKMAASKGLDADFIRDIYAQIIKHSCDLEANMIKDIRRQKAS